MLNSKSLSMLNSVTYSSSLLVENRSSDSNSIKFSQFSFYFTLFPSQLFEYFCFSFSISPEPLVFIRTLNPSILSDSYFSAHYLASFAQKVTLFSSLPVNPWIWSPITIIRMPKAIHIFPFHCLFGGGGLICSKTNSFSAEIFFYEICGGLQISIEWVGKWSSDLRHHLQSLFCLRFLFSIQRFWILRRMSSNSFFFFSRARFEFILFWRRRLALLSKPSSFHNSFSFRFMPSKRSCCRGESCQCIDFSSRPEQLVFQKSKEMFSSSFWGYSCQWFIYYCSYSCTQLKQAHTYQIINKCDKFD